MPTRAVGEALVHPVEVAHQVVGRTRMALTPVRLTTPKPLVTRLLWSVSP